VVGFIEWYFSMMREGLDRLRKLPRRFYLQGAVMAFIESELSHDKRRNLIVYERFPSILFARIREGIY
jgi:hypothetical protein